MTNRFTTPFTAESTADDVLAGVDLSGRRAIVTGASSGLGIETARALAAAGAEVTLAVRDTAAGEKTAAEITASTGNTAVSVRPLDLADQASVAAFVAGWDGPLHILVNNAGIMAAPELRTAEGWELQLATNHLGHFALATGLHASLAAAGDARIVALSSSAHLRSGIRFDDLQFERDAYDPWLAYGQSKTANVLFAVEATRRWADDGITANAVMPGGIGTNLMRYLDIEVLKAMGAANTGANAIVPKTVPQGAATSVLLAGSPLLEGVGGRYFEDGNEALPNDTGEGQSGVASYALDPVAAARLWDVSTALIAG